MTLFLLDVASYQGALEPTDVKRAGFQIVNLKVSHGLTQRAVHPDITGWISQARTLDLGICTFHFATGDTTGREQADYAFGRLRALGLVDGTGHVLDVESTGMTQVIVRDYIERMQALLGRPVMVYSADWFWEPKGWNVSDLTPYLHAAPNAGYLTAYPGDASPHWAAGYGGWPALSVMQYAVEPLHFPDGTHGTIDVSKSAIRDQAVWTALTGVTVAVSQNGWTVDFSGAKQDRGDIIPGVAAPNGVRSGDVATVLRYVARRFHAEVEPLRAGWCWGWYVKQITGTTDYSNHSSGTAVDFNAPDHPLGSTGTFSAAQVTAIHRILADCGGVVRWGGDYAVRKDEMHFEIVKGSAAVATLADRIKGGDMPTAADVWNVDGITNPSWRADAETNPTVQAKYALYDAWNQAHNAGMAATAVGAKMDKALALLTELSGRDFTDEPAIVAGVLAGLTGDQVVDMLRRAYSPEELAGIAARLQG